MSSSIAVGAVSPAPTDEELAAIVAAVELAWPRPVVVVAARPKTTATDWRFSGRWWNNNPLVGRPRP